MKKVVITVSILIALIFIGYGVYFFSAKSNDVNKPSVTQGDASDSSIDYSAPEKEELDSAEKIKEETINESSTPLANIKPVVSTWGKSDDGSEFIVSGFIPSIIESGGICKITLSGNGYVEAKERDGYPNAQDTICGPIAFTYSELPTSFTAKLEYKSEKYSGESATVRIDL